MQQDDPIEAPAGSRAPNPTVSVILPVYNGANFVRNAIESVLRQSFQDFEVIVVDDGSTDATHEAVKSCAGPIRYVWQENAGAAAAFNHGLRLARGHYISWLSHDDEFLPEKLEAQLDAIAESHEPAVCYTDIEFMDQEGKIIDALDLPEYPPGELLRNIVVASEVGWGAYSVLYDRRCIDEVGGYDLSQKLTEDADMLLRMGRQFRFIRVARRLMRVRQHGGRASLKPAWAHEARRFYEQSLQRLSLPELFPEFGDQPSALQRARARRWMGDAYARHAAPPYLSLAAAQYVKALGENPAILPSLVPRVARLARSYFRNNRQFYRLGLRNALRRRLATPKS